MPFSVYDALMGISEMPKREIPFCSLVPHQTVVLLPFTAGRGKKKKLKWWYILHISLALTVHFHSGAFLQL